MRVPWPTTAAVVVLCCLTASAAEADVVVLANEADVDVSFVTGSAQSTSQRHSIAPKGVLPVPTANELEISFDVGGVRRRYLLAPNVIYCFSKQDGVLDLHKVDFFEGVDPDAESTESVVEPPDTVPPVNSIGGVASFYRMGVVPVMILVDDEQRLVQSKWEKRFRSRLEEASDIFQRSCRMRFRVIAVGTWDSDDTIRDFSEALAEFHREVIPDPTALAIGFTSQHQPPRAGTVRLGGIRGPLSRHLLVAEGSKAISEPERLEVLVHELGHFLGAVHCPDPLVVMRPVLGDGQARLRDFQIRFDAGNTLIMYLVASELRTGGVSEFNAMSPVTKRTLRAVYSAIAKAVPEDKSAKQHLARLEGPGETIPVQLTPAKSVVASTRNVVQAIVRAAKEDRRGSEPNLRAPGRLAGDRLTDHCIRRAAAAAVLESSDLSTRSFLLGLAIALDDSRVLRDNPLTGALCQGVESDQQQRQRVEVLGNVTMFGRRDLAQHFVISCGLTALLGPRTAEAVGIFKEVTDSQRNSGFSFADLLADMSGVVFSQDVLSGDIQLDELAKSFRVVDYMPDPAGEEEGIPWREFVSSYGSAQDERFHRRKDAIRDRILSLPKYQ